jgi:hypothetical protein
MPYIANGKDEYDDVPLTQWEKQLRHDIMQARYQALQATREGEGKVNEKDVKWASQMLIAYEQHEIVLLPSEVAHYRAVVEADYQHRVRQSHDFLDKVLGVEQGGEIEEEPIDARIERAHVGIGQRIARWLHGIVDAVFGDVP